MGKNWKKLLVERVHSIITVSEAILAGRQNGSKQEHLDENSMSNIFNDTLVSNKLWIENFNVTKEELNAKIWGM